MYQEAVNYLEGIAQHTNEDFKVYYLFTGALTPATKGSGLATVCVAIYLFLKYINKPEEALTTAINMYGSDTDTIGIFLGALLGAYHGISIVPSHLVDRVQDRDYLLKTAKHLHSIAIGERREKIAIKQPVKRQEAYFRILGWEIGLHDMFWDTLGTGEIVVHPALGRGRIEQKVEKPIGREDYVAKLISIQFDCGQSCIFHSRVQNNEKVSESLAQDVANALV